MLKAGTVEECLPAGTKLTRRRRSATSTSATWTSRRSGWPTRPPTSGSAPGIDAANARERRQGRGEGRGPDRQDPPAGRAAAGRHPAGEGVLRREAEDLGGRQDGRPPRQQGHRRPHRAGGGHAVPAGRHAGGHRAQPARRAEPDERGPDPGDPPRVVRPDPRLQGQDPGVPGRRTRARSACCCGWPGSSGPREALRAAEAPPPATRKRDDRDAWCTTSAGAHGEDGTRSSTTPALNDLGGRHVSAGDARASSTASATFLVDAAQELADRERRAAPTRDSRSTTRWARTRDRRREAEACAGAAQGAREEPRQRERRTCCRRAGWPGAGGDARAGKVRGGRGRGGRRADARTPGLTPAGKARLRDGRTRRARSRAT